VAKHPRRVFVHQDGDEPTNEPIESDEEAAEAERLRRDVAVRLMGVMLFTVYEDHTAKLTEGQGLTLVVVPHIEWVRVVRDALRFCRYLAGKALVQVRDGQRKSSRDEGWAFVELTGRLNCDASTRIATALAFGHPVVAVTHDRQRLPEGVEGAADRVLVLRPPTWALVHRAALCAYEWGQRRQLVFWSPEGHDPALVENVTPSLLALCHRPDQRSYEFCERLARVLKSQTPSSGRSGGLRGLARVPGLPLGVQGWARCLVRDLALYKRGSLPWSEVDRGALFYGPPGTGKTTLALALAEEAGVPLVVCGHGVWQEKGHQGDMLRAMRASFAEARAQAPALLFIDEMDSFPPRGSGRRDHDSYTRQVVNALLAEMDGIGTREGVVIIAACNDATMVDPALVRAGRLDHRFQMELPAPTSIEAILRVHLRHELRDEPLADIAAIAHGMSGAELEAAVRSARKAARLCGRPMRRGDLLVAVSEARGIELTAPAAMVH